MQLAFMLHEDKPLTYSYIFSCVSLLKGTHLGTQLHNHLQQQRVTHGAFGQQQRVTQGAQRNRIHSKEKFTTS